MNVNTTWIYAFFGMIVAVELAASSPVEIVCGGTNAAGYRERAMATQRLGVSLGSTEIASLYDFLSSRVATHPKLTTNDLASIKNDVLNALEAQQQLPDTLGQVMLSNYTDPQHDPTWRAFCLQNFQQYYWRRWLQEPVITNIAEFAAEKSMIESNLWAAAFGNNDEFCCIALRVLDGIAVSNGTVTVTQMVAAAVLVANDTSRSAGVRAHALEIASRYGSKEVLATARKLAKECADQLLRHTAIRALGLIGTGADEKLLEELAQSSDPVVRSVAADALAEYLDRHQKPKPHKPGCPCSHCR